MIYWIITVSYTHLDRTELVMGQDPAVELCEIEYRDLQEAIDGETEY